MGEATEEEFRKDKAFERPTKTTKTQNEEEEVTEEFHDDNKAFENVLMSKSSGEDEIYENVLMSKSSGGEDEFYDDRAFEKVLVSKSSGEDEASIESAENEKEI